MFDPICAVSGILSQEQETGFYHVVARRRISFCLTMVVQLQWGEATMASDERTGLEEVCRPCSAAHLCIWQTEIPQQFKFGVKESVIKQAFRVSGWHFIKWWYWYTEREEGVGKDIEQVLLLLLKCVHWLWEKKQSRESSGCILTLCVWYDMCPWTELCSFWICFPRDPLNSPVPPLLPIS